MYYTLPIYHLNDLSHTQDQMQTLHGEASLYLLTMHVKIIWPKVNFREKSS